VGGAGADNFTFTAGVINVSGGAGNDTITDATALAASDTIAGGDGTDTLSSTYALVAGAYAAVPTTRTITGIETLSLSTAVTGALNAVAVDTGITTVTMAVNATNTSADVTFNAGASTLNIGPATGTAGTITTLLTVNGATTDGDNITIKNNNLSTANAFSSAAGAAVNITSTNAETLTLNTGSYTTAVPQIAGTVTVTGSTGFQTAETLVITGANILTLAAVTADVINASAMTATTGTVLTTVTGTTAQTVTGSAGNDVLVADTTSNVSINGGAGNDTITGGIGNDTLLGGLGADVITSGAGNDSVDAGAGDDSLTATLSAADTLIGGDGTDTLTLNIIATAANAVGVSGWETIAVIAGTQTMAAFPSTNAISRINVPTGSTVITNAGAAAVTLGAATTTTAVTFGLANCVFQPMADSVSV
jgi:Ca2+-binding RTX toxin-like protein